MSVKIVLGKRPESFMHEVTCPLPTGEVGVINVEFYYRTRTEYGEMVSEILKEAKVKLEGTAPSDVDFALARVLERQTASQADHFMKAVKSWDLEAEFSRANVAQLSDEWPGIVLQTIADYGAFCREGRLGN